MNVKTLIEKLNKMVEKDPAIAFSHVKLKQYEDINDDDGTSSANDVDIDYKNDVVIL